MVKIAGEVDPHSRSEAPWGRVQVSLRRLAFPQCHQQTLGLQVGWLRYRNAGSSRLKTRNRGTSARAMVMQTAVDNAVQVFAATHSWPLRPTPLQTAEIGIGRYRSSLPAASIRHEEKGSRLPMTISRRQELQVVAEQAVGSFGSRGLYKTEYMGARRSGRRTRRPACSPAYSARVTGLGQYHSTSIHQRQLGITPGFASASR